MTIEKRERLQNKIIRKLCHTLYDLSNDIKEADDISGNHPEMVKEMYELLKNYIKDGRSN